MHFSPIQANQALILFSRKSHSDRLLRDSMSRLRATIRGQPIALCETWPKLVISETKNCPQINLNKNSILFLKHYFSLRNKSIFILNDIFYESLTFWAKIEKYEAFQMYFHIYFLFWKVFFWINHVTEESSSNSRICSISYFN